MTAQPTHLAIESLVREDESVEVTFRIEAPTNVPEGSSSRVLCCDGQALRDLSAVPPGFMAADENLVRDAGEEVFNRLCIHPGVRQALERAHNNEAFPIWIETRAEEAEMLPWEALYDPQRQRFFALDGRWPIVRMAGRRSDTGTIERMVDAPLRVGIVLAASEMPAAPEWKELHSQLSDWSNDVEIMVWTYEQGVIDEIEAAAEPLLQVGWVPSSEDDLIREIGIFKPHILHFFCHGSSAYGGYLEVARNSTVIAGAEPLFLNARHIGRVCDSTILVVLNACEGATAVKDLHSLAYSLVKEGAPAVIGMREAIDSHDANLFSKHTVSEMLNNLNAGFARKNRTALDWSAILGHPRREMCRRQNGPLDHAASSCKAWTLPALYVRPEPLFVEFVPAEPQAPQPQSAAARDYLVSLLNTLITRRVEMHPDTPPERLASIDQAIDNIREMLLGGQQEPDAANNNAPEG